MVALLLDGGANPDVADKEGNTLLHAAKSAKLVSILLQRGLGPNMANQVSSSNLLIVRLLMGCSFPRFNYLASFK